MPRPPVTISTVLALTSLWASGLTGCGGPSEEQVRQSEAQYNLGVGLMQEQNVAGAFQHLQEAIRLDPDNADAHLLLGKLFLFRNELDRAEHHLREAMRANDALGSAGRPALAAEARNTLGVVYIHGERLDDAIAELTVATSDLLNRTPFFAWTNLGWAYYEKRDYAQALTALQEAVRSNAGFCNAWYRMGQTYFAMAEQAPSAAADTDFGRAEHALTSALENEADSCQRLQDAWLLRGRTRARLGRHDDARADLERCIELNSDTEAGRTCASMLESTP